MRYSDKVPQMLIDAAAKKPFRPTQLALARMFCVSVSTIKQWKQKHTAFAEAVTAANEMIVDTLEDAAITRALGYDFVETREEETDDGIRKITIRKHMPAEPTLLRYLLNNRRPEEWKDKQEVHQTGETTTTIIVQETDLKTL